MKKELEVCIFLSKIINSLRINGASKGRYAWAGQEIEHLLNHKTIQQIPVLYRSNSYPLRPRRITRIKANREGVKSGGSGAHKPSRLGLIGKATKCSDAGTGDLSVLPTHEPSPCFFLGDAGVVG